MNMADAPRVSGMIHRRELLERDEPVDFHAEWAAITKVYPAPATIAWILNVPRTTLIGWMAGGKIDYENGRAVRKLAAKCRESVTPET